MITLATLALGIGLNTAVFSVVSAILLRPLPIPESARLVRVLEIGPPPEREPDEVSSPNFLDWQAETRALDAMALIGGRPVTLTGSGDAELIRAMTVSPDFARVMSARPALGRLFTPADYAPQTAQFQLRPRPLETLRPSVIILGHDLWQRRFGGRPDIVGRHRAPGRPERRSRRRDAAGLRVHRDPLSGATRTAGCPKRQTPSSGAPGCSRSWAGWRLAARSRRHRRSSTSSPHNSPSNIHGPTRTAASASPLCSRSRPPPSGRSSGCCSAPPGVFSSSVAPTSRIFSSRTPLGDASSSPHALRSAPRARTSSARRSPRVFSSVCREAPPVLALAIWALPALVALAPPEMPRLHEIAVNWQMLAFAVVTSVVVGLACGLAVVVSMDRVNPQAGGLRPSGADAAHHGRRFRHGLIVVEIALALMLVVAAGLLVRTLRVLGGQELGFDPRNVIGVGFCSTGTEYDYRSGAASQFEADSIERLKTAPRSSLGRDRLAVRSAAAAAWAMTFGSKGASRITT